MPDDKWATWEFIPVHHAPINGDDTVEPSKILDLPICFGMFTSFNMTLSIIHRFYDKLTSFKSKNDCCKFAEIGKVNGNHCIASNQASSKSKNAKLQMYLCFETNTSSFAASALKVVHLSQNGGFITFMWHFQLKY